MRGALVEEFGDGALGVVVIEEGSVGVPRGALEDLAGFGDEPDDVSELPEDLAVFLSDDDAAAGGDDGAFVIEEVGEDGGFAVAEGGFAFVCKDGGNGFAGFFLDEVVGIDEGVVEHLGQFATDGGLTSPHESDQHDVLRHGGSVSGMGGETNTKFG